MNKYKRKLLNFILMFISNGYKKADILRRLKIFGLIGDNVYYQPYTFGTEPHLIFLYKNVHIAANVSLITHDVVGLMASKMLNTNVKNKVGKIVIKENVFIGSGAIILPNVTIGPNSIIAAGSIVTKDVPSGVIIGGNPAKVIGSFNEYIEKLIEWSGKIEWDEFIDNRQVLVKRQREYFGGEMNESSTD